jgi:hypothetical protein
MVELMGERKHASDTMTRYKHFWKLVNLEKLSSSVDTTASMETAASSSESVFMVRSTGKNEGNTLYFGGLTVSSRIIAKTSRQRDEP